MEKVHVPGVRPYIGQYIRIMAGHRYRIEISPTAEEGVVRACITVSHDRRARIVRERLRAAGYSHSHSNAKDGDGTTHLRSHTTLCTTEIGDR